MEQEKTSDDYEEIDCLISPFKKSDSVSVTNHWKIPSYISALTVLILSAVLINSKITDQANVSNISSVGWSSSLVTYGLVHMARSGGSALNKILALKYERVCGNKGYSYNAYEINEENRLRHSMNLTAIQIKENREKRIADRMGKKPLEDRYKTGFDDCDYIALEMPAEMWQMRMGDLQRPFELHVPCRDPIDHFMSICTFRKQRFHTPKFRCNASNEELQIQVHGCIKGLLGRFSMNMASSKNFTMKCFSSPSKIDSYIKYMGDKLQKKRIQAEYFDVTSNGFQRHKETECIWEKSNEGVRMRLEEILFKTEYFKYCKDCIGSEDDLLR